MVFTILRRQIVLVRLRVDNLPLLNLSLDNLLLLFGFVLWLLLRGLVLRRRVGIVVGFVRSRLIFWCLRVGLWIGLVHRYFYYFWCYLFLKILFFFWDIRKVQIYCLKKKAFIILSINTQIKRNEKRVEEYCFLGDILREIGWEEWESWTSVWESKK